MKKSFFHPIDSYGTEVIFAPFHDPLLSSQLPLIVKNGLSNKIKMSFDWCWTKLSWNSRENNCYAGSISCQVFKDIRNYSHFIACLNAPSNVSYRFSADFGAGHIPISNEFIGKSTRDEQIIPIPRSIKINSDFLNYFTIDIFSKDSGPCQLILSWFGLRDDECYQTIHNKRRNKELPEWDNFIYPQEEWGDIAFARGLLFDEDALDDVRRKKRQKGWRAHYQILKSQAETYMQRVPEADLGPYLPTSDQRYIRASERGKSPYHWEALVLAFVGLVDQNPSMIQHALRYMMCMAYTPNWTESAEHHIPSSTWDSRCFLAEMTTTSLSILLDWLDFTLRPPTKKWLHQALWDRGISFVKRDLMKNKYMHHMNQGAVFSRACILGGLMLEDHWDMRSFVDDCFMKMEEILEDYIQSDGSVHEGPAYFCQLMQGTIPAIIAYHRARNKDFRACLKHHFGKSIPFIETLSGSAPGTTIPIGDSRTHWFCGDGIPILADLYPDSSIPNILESTLKAGQVFQVIGTLTGSGGLLGMVYGPAEVKPSSSIQQKFSVLKDSGLLSWKRTQNSRHVSFFLSGSRGRQTHTHKDCGAFVLTVNDIPIFIDRGMLEYNFIGALNLPESSMHNSLTPILSENKFPSHSHPFCPIIPNYSHDKHHSYASIDLTSIWLDYFLNYKRSFKSNSLDNFLIIEDGKLKQKRSLALHLHTPHQIIKNFKTISIHNNESICTINANWANDIIIDQDNLYLNGNNINHITIISNPIDSFFQLKTSIKIVFTNNGLDLANVKPS